MWMLAEGAGPEDDEEEGSAEVVAEFFADESVADGLAPLSLDLSERFDPGVDAALSSPWLLGTSFMVTSAAAV